MRTHTHTHATYIDRYGGTHGPGTASGTLDRDDAYVMLVALKR